MKNEDRKMKKEKRRENGSLFPKSILPFSLTFFFLIFSLFFFIFPACDDSNSKEDDSALTPWKRGEGFFKYTGYEPLSDRPVNVFYYIPEDGDITTMRVLFAMHGLNGGVDNSTVTNWKNNSVNVNFVIIAPGYTDENGWSTGTYQSAGINSGAREKWTYNTIEALFDDFKKHTGNLSETYDIAGHSAGGQAAHRFLLTGMPNMRARLVIAANPSTWAFPFIQGIPDEIGNFQEYGWPNSIYNTQFANEDDVKRYLSAPLIIHLGDNDIDTEDPTLAVGEGAIAQGPQRFARGTKFFADSQQLALDMDTLFNWEKVVVAGVGHSSAGMIRGGASSSTAVRETGSYHLLFESTIGDDMFRRALNAGFYDAAKPVIAVQDITDIIVGTGETFTLTVPAVSRCGGDLSYQWYSNTSADNTGGTAISGAVNASYISTAAAEGIYYYYAAVTNTNNKVLGNKTATVISDVIKVIVEQGAGTNAYIIKTAAQLASLAESVNSSDQSVREMYNNRTYYLENDIDLSDYTPWTPIGISSSRPFSGVFDGNGKIITGLTINTESNYQGLFGCLGGTVKNLGLEEVEITGGRYTGGIAGYTGSNSASNPYSGIISNCYTSGVITGTSQAGGITGRITDINSVIENCYSTATINAEQSVGGIAGYIDSGTIKNCAALNESIQADQYINRIHGWWTGSGAYTLENNIAFADMPVNGAKPTTNIGLSTRNGADFTAAQVAADGTLGGLFTAPVWTTQNGKLPGFGQARDLAGYLRQ